MANVAYKPTSKTKVNVKVAEKLRDYFSVNLTAAGSYTLPFDIILTAIDLSCGCSNDKGACYVNAWIFRTNIVVATVRINGGNASSTSGDSGNLLVPIPEWHLYAGTIIGMAESADTSSSVSFIGYRYY